MDRDAWTPVGEGMGRLLQGTWMARTSSWSKGRKKKSSAAFGVANKRENLLRARASKMKGEPTPSEERVFFALRYLRVPFMPQVVIGRFIVDFLLTDRNMILEVDGSSHDKKQQYDKKRDAFLSRLGWTVLHVANELATVEWLRGMLADVPLAEQKEIIQRLSDARAIERDRVHRVAARKKSSKVIDQASMLG